MKTRQWMIRTLGDYIISQETVFGYFNATAFLNQWNERHPNRRKTLNNFWGQANLAEFLLKMVEKEGLGDKDFKIKVKEYKEFINADLLTKLSIMNGDFSNTDSKEGSSDTSDKDSKNELDIIELSKNQKDKLQRYINKRKQQFCRSCKKYVTLVSKGTAMHPLLFLKFAMYIDKEFEYEVLKFVKDKLIDYRRKNCDTLNRLKDAMGKYWSDVTDDDYKNITKNIQKLICGKAYSNNSTKLRQQVGQREQYFMAKLQQLFTQIIELGIVRSHKELAQWFNDQKEDKDSYMHRYLNEDVPEF